MILNLTQHPTTPEQIAAGVIEPRDKERVRELLTFSQLPSTEELVEVADMLAVIAREHDAKQAMIGGAPFFMSALEEALELAGIQPLYAFSMRECVEEPQADGSVRKTNVFRHAGFVRPAPRIGSDICTTKENNNG